MPVHERRFTIPNCEQNYGIIVEQIARTHLKLTVLHHHLHTSGKIQRTIAGEMCEDEEEMIEILD